LTKNIVMADTTVSWAQKIILSANFCCSRCSGWNKRTI